MPNIYITGFSGSGKSSVGREVASLLGWRFVDIDEEIVRRAGMAIDRIFEEDGELRFRELEYETLERVGRGAGQVVSTGGGIVMEERNRDLMGTTGLVVCLEAIPDTIHRRLKAEQGESPRPVIRPMLAGPDPLARITALKSERQLSYSLAQWTVHTDRMTPREAAREVARAYEKLTGREEGESAQARSGTRGGGEDGPDAMVRTSSGDYPVWVGWGSLAELGARVKDLLSPGAAYVVTDEAVHRHARRAQVSLEAAGIPCHIFLVPPGERSKTLRTAQQVFEWLADLRAERGHLIVAVGGGMVGDLAGFVAATFLRGVRLGHVPTSLLAMTDASIGGKTAVDLPQGKNLVGSFYQPSFVLADVETLQSLPDRELASGWAEAIKHGLILDEGLLRIFEAEKKAIVGLDLEVSTDVIRRSVAIKADVVSRDERETLGIRVLLNYGHTIGHALEAATKYEMFLHGEAVSIGMMGAALISEGLGMLSGRDVERQRAVLLDFGLPVSFEGVDPEAVYRATALDKKTAGGVIRWVLLDGIGRAVTRRDVPRNLVMQALSTLRI